MRARLPDHEGYAERNGVKLHYEVHGSGDTTILLLPAWTYYDSRVWKGQYAYLARHFRVVTFDPPGSRASSTPESPEAYGTAAVAADAAAVLDATETDSAVVAGLSAGGASALLLAAMAPDRVDAVLAAAPAMPLTGDQGVARLGEHWFDDADEPEGMAHFNRDLWQRPGGFRRWAEWFAALNHPEPGSSWPIEQAVRWADEIGSEATLRFWDAAVAGMADYDPAVVEALLEQIRCPVVVVHGTDDHVIPFATGEQVARHLAAELVVWEGAGHDLPGRHPVGMNLELRRLAELTGPAPRAQRSWRRALTRPRRVLYLSSPIGLGHARRDLAIAEELRRLRPDVEVDWLTQHPVTAMLADRGERVHPMADHLASESAHIEAESAEHDLHCFQALREMDEVLANNFMVFHDLVEAEHYDLVVADESWEVDHFLREHPELKRSPYAWISDFDGFLPMPDGGDYEARVAAEHNAYVIDGVERFPTLRDAAIFVGNPDDVVPHRFGPDLPVIRDWVEDHYRFAGYVTGFDPVDDDERAALRAELGYRPDERICIVTVGGSGVGGALLRKVVAGHDLARRLVPGLRMVVVTGPRLDPCSVPSAEGLEVHGYVPDLYRHLAVCDVAVVQGGLTTSMELTANQRPFLYFPLRHHFEQNIHVRHRLERHGAGRCMDYGTATPESIAEALAAEIGREVDYLPVETDGAARAAAMLEELL
jgi:pimeloyl-ACP methyl ester carboxylesterase/predicted glycosyltransferase